MGTRILIVDDSPLMNQMIADILETAGYEARAVLSGTQALEMIETWLPDLVLLDVMMPEMDGFEVCRQLREDQRTKSTPVILVSAKSSIEDKQRGNEVGADDYITKPFEPAELKLRLKAMLNPAGRRNPSTPHAASRLLAVHSLRGGSGCSSLAVNIAAGLQMLWGRPVVLVDLARPVGVCGSMLNLHSPHGIETLLGQAQDTWEPERIQALLGRHSSGLQLLAGFNSPAAAEKLTENHVSMLLIQLLKVFSFVVVDAAHDFTPPITAALEHADELILPVPPDINAAFLAQVELNTLAALGYNRELFLIRNNTFAEGNLPPEEMEQFLGESFCMEIPYSSGEWATAINEGKPVITGSPDLPAVRILEDLVWRISGPDMWAIQPDFPVDLWNRIRSRQIR